MNRESIEGCIMNYKIIADSSCNVLTGEMGDFASVPM